MNGIVAINKSSGISSSDVVIRCRNIVSKIAGEKIRCGHFGTLDPAAAGVLLIGFGKSTRLFDYFMDKKKKYRAQFVFGKQTDTFDSFGKLVAEDSLPLTIDVINCISSFVGEIMQTPPIFSAKNVGGVRAYDMARRGIDVVLAPKKVQIYDINIVRIETVGNCCQSIELDIECGGGTYIRSLCRDIAFVSKSVGYMSYLIRTQVGNFSINDAVLEQDFVLSPQNYIADEISVLKQIMPIVEIEPEFRKAITNGVAVDIGSLIGLPFAVTFDGKLFGIARNNCGLTKVVTNLWQD